MKVYKGSTPVKIYNGNHKMPKIYKGSTLLCSDTVNYHYRVENLVSNGDLSGGETGWEFVSNSDVIGGQFVTTGGIGFCRQFVAIETGHDVIAICKYNRSSIGAVFVLSDGTGMYDGRVNATGLQTDGEWHTGKVRRTVVAGGTWLVFGSTGVNTVGTAYADDFILIDLTALETDLGITITQEDVETWISKLPNQYIDQFAMW